MERYIYFDMDGVLCGLYNVENWLDYLIAEDVTPYAIAKPLVNLSILARRIHQIQAKGYKVGIISWLSKNGSPEYNIAVTQTKIKWLKTHLPSVKWSEIHIVKYGTPKSHFRSESNAILFDDEERNRTEWGENAFVPEQIASILSELG